MATECGIQILLWVLISIVGVIIIMYIAFALYIRNLEQSFINAVTKNFENFCENMPPITYRESVALPAVENNYSQQLAVALIDISYAVSYANCSGVEVPNPPTFTNQLRITGLEPISGETLMFAYIFWNTDTAVIAFTGTEFVSEWRSDFQFQQVEPTGINNYKAGVLVHKGFYDIYTNVRTTLMKWWTDNSPSITTLYITGHSLGGGLSNLCAYDFASLPQTLVHYSFASPRTGNSTFAVAFNGLVTNTIRVNNTEDLIPQLPPSTFKGWNYEQTGGNAPFTISLSSLVEDHIEAYKDYLPTCPQVAGCNT